MGKLRLGGRLHGEASFTEPKNGKTGVGAPDCPLPGTASLKTFKGGSFSYPHPSGELDFCALLPSAPRAGMPFQPTASASAHVHGVGGIWVSGWVLADTCLSEPVSSSGKWV